MDGQSSEQTVDGDLDYDDEDGETEDDDEEIAAAADYDDSEYESDDGDEEDDDLLRTFNKTAKDANGIPSLNLQPRINRSMILEFDRNSRQSNFFIDPHFKRDGVPGANFYEDESEEDSFQE